jgi:hypothetical protein
MNYPLFFDTIEPIVLIDPLADTLGAFDEGKYTLSYTDIVKAAGHSCPTVAGAFLMAREGLKHLFPNTPAMRGEVEVFFKESLHVGVTGVLANVLTHITGATDVSGFKGLNGIFARHGLMHFDCTMQGIMQLKRCDTQAMVELTYDPSAITPDASMMLLMQKILSNNANKEEQQRFAMLWQERVERIFANVQKVITVIG